MRHNPIPVRPVRRAVPVVDRLLEMERERYVSGAIDLASFEEKVERILRKSSRISASQFPVPTMEQVRV